MVGKISSPHWTACDSFLEKVSAECGTDSMKNFGGITGQRKRNDVEE